MKRESRYKLKIKNKTQYYKEYSDKLYDKVVESDKGIYKVLIIICSLILGFILKIPHSYLQMHLDIIYIIKIIAILSIFTIILIGIDMLLYSSHLYKLYSAIKTYVKQLEKIENKSTNYIFDKDKKFDSEINNIQTNNYVDMGAIIYGFFIIDILSIWILICKELS